MRNSVIYTGHLVLLG